MSFFGSSEKPLSQPQDMISNEKLTAALPVVSFVVCHLYELILVPFSLLSLINTLPWDYINPLIHLSSNLQSVSRSSNTHSIPEYILPTLSYKSAQAWDRARDNSGFFFLDKVRVVLRTGVTCRLMLLFQREAKPDRYQGNHNVGPSYLPACGAAGFSWW